MIVNNQKLASYFFKNKTIFFLNPKQMHPNCMITQKNIFIFFKLALYICTKKKLALYMIFL